MRWSRETVPVTAVAIDTECVKTYAAWRAARPGHWLAAALAADVATYATAGDRSAAVLPWLVLDLWLAYRIWNGGATALAWFRGLQLAAVFIFGVALALAQLGERFSTTAGPGALVLCAVVAWCLMATALSEHVAAAPSSSRPAVSAG